MSQKIGVIVQARMSSSRFPGKILMKIGKFPLIYYVVKRLESLGYPVIVCTSDQASDDMLCEYLRSENINIFRGNLNNVLERYILAARAYEIRHIVRVTGDNPFVDIESLKENLHFLNQYAYVDGIYHGGVIKGVGYELVKLSELEKIPSRQKEHLEHVTLWLRENRCPSGQRILLKPGENNRYRSDVFLTCDYPEDFELLSIIFQKFNYRYDTPLVEILNFLENNADLKKINSFRHHHPPTSI